MKILQIIPSLDMGGAEVMCETLSNQLKKLGHSVTVVSMFRKETVITRRLQAAGVPVVFLDKKSGLDLGCIRKLRRLLRREKPDAIHVHLYILKYVGLAAFGLGIPIIHTVHNVAEEDAEGDGAINRLLYKRGGVIPVSLSREIQKTVVSFYGVPEEASPVIYNGINLENCLPKSDYRLSQPVRLLHVGRFNHQKNHPCMVQALKLLRERGYDTELTFLGGGDLLPEVRRQAQELGVAEYIHFEGISDWVYPHLQQADLFLLPSHFEGMPMSLIEAMGTGLPVIASRVGGIPDMVTDGHNGLLIDPNAEELANAIARLLDDPELRERLGRNAKEEAVRFSGETMARNYMKLYQNA